MAYIPTGVIFIWTGTHASIPSGWQRETSLDGKFIKGAPNATDPNVTGGTDTHSHSSSAHTHTLASHTHGGQTSRDGPSEDTDSSNSNAARDQHVHDWTSDGPTGGNLSDTITYQSVSSLPPYYEVIFIKPNTSHAGVPDGALALYNSSTVPTGWNKCDGTSSTPNLTDKFLRGAATAGNAGGTGGATSHAHTVDHTHSAVTHTHNGTTGGNSDGGKARDSSGAQVVQNGHTHTFTLPANSSETGSAYTGTAGSADTGIEPLHKKLYAIKNNNGFASRPRTVIGMWLGDLADIPLGWALCDGSSGTPDLRDYHLKITNTGGDIGTTGGANTHIHAASNSHTHTAAGSHTHGSTTTSSISGVGSTGVSGDNAAKPHTHTTGTSTSGTSVWNSTTIAASSSNNEPAYRTVAFIQLLFDRSGGGFPLMAL